MYDVSFKTICESENAFTLIPKVCSRVRTAQRMESRRLTGISSNPGGPSWRSVTGNRAFTKTQLIFRGIKHLDGSLLKNIKHVRSPLLLSVFDKDVAFPLPCPQLPRSPAVTRTLLGSGLLGKCIFTELLGKGTPECMSGCMKTAHGASVPHFYKMTALLGKGGIL